MNGSGSGMRRPATVGRLAVVLLPAVYTSLLAGGYFLGWRIAKHRVESAWLIFAGASWIVAALAAWFTPRLAVQKPATAPGMIVWLWCGGMMAASVVLYAPALSMGFLSDDFVLIARAIGHDFFSPGTTEFLRPVPLAAWAAIAALPVPTAPAVHGLNILLHGLNAGLVAVLATRLGLARVTGAAASLLLLCFPAGVEAVGWASGVQDVMLVTFGLAFVLCCFSGRPRIGVAAGVAFLILALGSKETAVALPLMAVIVSWTGTRGSGWRWQVPCSGLLLAVAYVGWRMAGRGIPGSYMTSPSRYFLKELLSHSFGTLAVPFTGREIQAAPLLGVFLALLVAALVLCAPWWWRVPRTMFAGVTSLLLWIVLSVLPVWSMFFVSADLQGSRYVYLAACGWSILIAALSTEITSRPWRLAARIGLAALIVVSAAGVRWHLDEWRRASVLRDAVLQQADITLRAGGCAAFVFSDLPDSVGGAYVFRNGFVEALASRRVAGVERARPNASAGAPRDVCPARWDGTSFRLP